jgi:SAM-dependent methyltransferase
MVSGKGVKVNPDREKWDRKYREGHFSPEPSRIVREFYIRAPKGRALDLACGNGRNACFLAERGFEVDAVDISEVGLRRFVCRSPAINRICQDLDTFVIRPGRYQLIVNTRFLKRNLFAALPAGLAPGGVLIFETYLMVDAPEAAHRFSPDHLLRDDELRHAFPTLQIIDYREISSPSQDAPDRTASLIALRPPA